MALHPQSLTTRLVLANALSLIAALAAGGAWLVHAEREERRRGSEERVWRFAEQTAGSLAEAWRQDAVAERVSSYLALESGIARVRLIAPDGRVLFDSRRPGSVPPPEADPRLLAAVRGTQPALVALEPAPTQVVVPTRSGGDPLAIVYELSYADAEAHVHWATSSIGWLVVIAIALSVVVGVVFAAGLRRQLQELAGAAQRIAEGRFEEPLPVSSGDELGALAERVNHMAARLQENIAELEESNRRLATANAELMELDQMKSDLIANVSHELRTPLTAIKGYTDYLRERKLGAVNPNQEKGLMVMQRNIERLSRSINALLDYSRLEAGRITLNRQPFSLPLLVDQVHQTLRSMIEKKGIVFSSAMERELPDVDADREKLGQVLENLIINAVKFTPEGGSIEVRGSASEGSHAVDVEVRDSGIGIAPEQLSRIFSRFHQVEGTSRRRFGGVGLGLAIVKSILEAHAIEIQVESVPGRSTAFRFSIPAARVDEAAEGAAEPPLLQ